jgi:hypothetical protein
VSHPLAVLGANDHSSSVMIRDDMWRNESGDVSKLAHPHGYKVKELTNVTPNL